MGGRLSQFWRVTGKHQHHQIDLILYAGKRGQGEDIFTLFMRIILQIFLTLDLIYNLFTFPFLPALMNIFQYSEKNYVFGNLLAVK